MEDDAFVPVPGDAVVYDWEDDGRGDNTGYPDHVGLVEAVSGGVITVIEGNMGAGRMVSRRLNVDGKYIRGFICPDYAALARDPAPSSGDRAEKTVAALAAEVIAGRWGNGADRGLHRPPGRHPHRRRPALRHHRGPPGRRQRHQKPGPHLRRPEADGPALSRPALGRETIPHGSARGLMPLIPPERKTVRPMGRTVFLL